jgi:methyl-accepting chemotaxis protein
MDRRPIIYRAIAFTSLPLIIPAILFLRAQIIEGERTVTEERQTIARAAAATTQTFVESNVSTLASVVLTDAFTAPDQFPDLQALMGRLRESNPDWVGLGLQDADGWTSLASLADGSARVFIGDRPYFQEAIASGRPVVSPAILGRATGRVTVPVAVPVDFRDGTRGVLVAPLAVDRLGEVLDHLPGAESIRITVVDSAGQDVLGRWSTEGTRLLSVGGMPGVSEVMGGASGNLVTRRGDEDALVAYAPIPKWSWGVLVEQPTALAFAGVNRAKWGGIGILALTLITVAVLASYSVSGC